MKKLITCSIAILFSLGWLQLLAQDHISLPMHSIRQNLHEAGLLPQLSDRPSTLPGDQRSLQGWQTRDGIFVVAQILTQVWADNFWADFNLRSNAYIMDTLLSEQLDQRWEFNNWVNFSQTTYTYNPQGQAISFNYMVWNSVLDQWSDLAQGSMTYEPLTGLLTEMTVLFNNGVVWTNGFHYFYAYNSQGQLLTTLTQEWDESGNQWVNASLETNAYNDEHFLAEVLEQLWYAGEWQDSRLWLYEYNPLGNIISILEQSWTMLGWVNELRNLLTYDAGGFLVIELQEQWNGNSWLSLFHWDYSYDANGNLMTSLEKQWQGEPKNWVNSKLLSYFYYQVGIEESLDLKGKSGLIIYPNPARGLVNIAFTTSIGMPGQLMITDAVGRLVFREELNPANNGVLVMQWNNAAGLPAGIYYARLILGNKVLNGKIELVSD